MAPICVAPPLAVRRDPAPDTTSTPLLLIETGVEPLLLVVARPVAALPIVSAAVAPAITMPPTALRLLPAPVTLHVAPPLDAVPSRNNAPVLPFWSADTWLAPVAVSMPPLMVRVPATASAALPAMLSVPPTSAESACTLPPVLIVRCAAAPPVRSSSPCTAMTDPVPVTLACPVPCSSPGATETAPISISGVPAAPVSTRTVPRWLTLRAPAPSSPTSIAPPLERVSVPPETVIVPGAAEPISSFAWPVPLTVPPAVISNAPLIVCVPESAATAPAPPTVITPPSNPLAAERCPAAPTVRLLPAVTT